MKSNFATKAFILIIFFFATTSSTFAKPLMPWEKDILELKAERADIFRESINDLAVHNIAYLALSVTAIFAFIGLVSAGIYFLNLKPFRQKLDRQEREQKKLQGKLNDQAQSQQQQQNDLNNLKNQTKASVKRMKGWMELEVKKGKNEMEEATLELEEKINESEQKLKSEIQQSVKNTLKEYEKALTKTTDMAKENELNRMWDSHIIWEARKVWENAISSLLIYIKKRLEYFPNQNKNQDIALGNINDNLQEIIKREFSVFDKNDYIEIEEVLSKVENSSVIKTKIRKQIDKIKKMDEEKEKMSYDK